MTNANLQNKIRIYDLARDLGRDNKDVLAVCQRLGITFKSHSSTISEQEAEQIRDAFQRGLPPGGRKKNKILQQGGVSGKQQILEVRRPPANYQPPTKPTDPVEAVEQQTVVEVIPPTVESVPDVLPVIAVELPVEEPVVEVAVVSAPVAETLSVQEAIEVLDVTLPVIEAIIPLEADLSIPEEPVATEPEIPMLPAEPDPARGKAVPTRPERQERRTEDSVATPSS
ncbi:MAG: translation initiation factor IF-2 N-terminal domain-containing protein, partial [Gemmatimonadaceae bacterium]|nr:translation initiation factor IF-2 N-terminal domain-containing protein [Gloeobacterales cyanobacterium ES-bin-141]